MVLIFAPFTLAIERECIGVEHWVPYGTRLVLLPTWQGLATYMIATHKLVLQIINVYGKKEKHC